MFRAVLTISTVPGRELSLGRTQRALMGARLTRRSAAGGGRPGHAARNATPKALTRRAAVLAAGQALLVAGLAGRMYQLQILEADRYRVLADENRINLRLLAPPRGRILDRFGVPLADNRQNYHRRHRRRAGRRHRGDLGGARHPARARRGGPPPGAARGPAQTFLCTGGGPRQPRLGRDGARRGRDPRIARRLDRAGPDPKLSVRCRPPRMCWAMSPRCRSRT